MYKGSVSEIMIFVKDYRAKLEFQLRKLDAERTLPDDEEKLIENQYSILQELAEFEEQVEDAEGG